MLVVLGVVVVALSGGGGGGGGRGGGIQPVLCYAIGWIDVGAYSGGRYYVLHVSIPTACYYSYMHAYSIIMLHV